MATGKIEFIANHRPALSVGNYTISVKQAITAGDKIKNKDGEEFSAELTFSVLGPPFILNPQDIQAVFPPDGSLGDHANVLPHIILNRSTFPWERRAFSNSEEIPKSEEIPWLALLLFEEEELPKDSIKTLSLSELTSASTDKTLKWPGLSSESGQPDGDRITVIDIPYDVLKNIMPTGKELKLLTHVRATSDATGKPGDDELAVIIGNRLPKRGGTSIVHLVSVEGQYKLDANHQNQILFDFQDAKSGDSIRLISLTSWRFACIADQPSFKGLLEKLDRNPLRLSRIGFDIKDQDISKDLNQGNTDLLKQNFLENNHSLNGTITVEPAQAKIIDQYQCYFISNTLKVYNQLSKYLFKLTSGTPTNTIAQPLKDQFANNNQPLTDEAKVEPINDCWWLNVTQPNTEQSNTDQYWIVQEGKPPSPKFHVYDPPALEAEAHFKMGCVPLSHAMRQGNKTVSWYHGPLVPGKNTTPQKSEFAFSVVRSADDLVLYNSDYGMFDVSYAAAWELGRLLALQSKSFSISLYNWKRTHSQAQKIKEAQQQIDYLPLDGPSASVELPETVSSWFEHLALLEGVPFNYLVPDERLLPPESIRFFQLDPMWMECLLDGAFSMGRVLTTDLDRDASLNKEVAPHTHTQISGFLLRSDVVAGWPGLQIDGYADSVSDTDAIPDRVSLPGYTKDSNNDNKNSLNRKDIQALRNLFSGLFSDSQKTQKIIIENRRWSFTAAGITYILLKRENNEIDVCTTTASNASEDQYTYQFSIDAAFETNLTAGYLPPDLIQIFQSKIPSFPTDSVPSVTVTGWFIADYGTAPAQYYSVQEEGTNLQVYQNKKLQLLRRATLSKNILICLFDGIVNTIDLHLKPETLHFGVDSPEDGSDFYLKKKLRDAQGAEFTLSSHITVPLREGPHHRVICIAETLKEDTLISIIKKKLEEKQDVKPLTAAEFALQMIEGSQKVRFSQG